MSSEQPIETLTATPVVRRWPHGPTKFEQRYGNGTMRVLTAIIGIPIVLGAVWIGGWAFFGLITLASIGALLEFYWMAEKKGAHPNKVIGVIAILLLSLQFLPQNEIRESLPYGVRSWVLPYYPDTRGLLPGDMFTYIVDFFISSFKGMQFPLILIPVILAFEMFRRKSEAIINFATTVGGITYLGLCLLPLIAIRQGDRLMPDNFPMAIVVSILVSIWTCDSFAYYGGRLFGKHKLFERVSPKKTWEGAICGIIGSVAAMFVIYRIVFPISMIPMIDIIIMGLICGIFGQIGDLAESHLKRDAQVKDSSQLIPGHGGVLDRFDSLLFVSPLIYLYTSARMESFLFPIRG